MSDLLKQALDDFEQVKEVAEKNAKNVLIERMMPKIRDWIDKQIIEGNESDGYDIEEKEQLLYDDEDEQSDDSEALVTDEEPVDNGESVLDLKSMESELFPGGELPDNDYDEEEDSEKMFDVNVDDIEDNKNESFGGFEKMSELYRLLEMACDCGEPGCEGECMSLPEEGVEAAPAAVEEGDKCTCPEDECVYSEGVDEWVEIDENELQEALSELNVLNKPEPRDKSLYEGKNKQNQPYNDKAKVDLDGEVLALKETIKAYRRKINEIESAMSKLRNQLQEANLFNAKLLYANKLVNGNKNMTQEQKLNIIETLDEATSLREVKLLFNTFTKTLTNKSNSGNRAVNESTVRKAGGSSQAVGSGASTQTLNESADLDRWQKLAGLK